MFFGKRTPKMCTFLSVLLLKITNSLSEKGSRHSRPETGTPFPILAGNRCRFEVRFFILTRTCNDFLIKTTQKY